MNQYDTWYPFRNAKPTRETQILVKIADKYFVGRVIKRDFGICYRKPEGEIIFFLDICYSFEGTAETYALKRTETYSGEWLIPSHYKEPSYWCYIEEPPKNMDS
jgi:hypothetical protein